jgi:hypothetical protein
MRSPLPVMKLEKETKSRSHKNTHSFLLKGRKHIVKEYITEFTIHNSVFKIRFELHKGHPLHSLTRFCTGLLEWWTLFNKI